jgi:CHAT domain-containing protein/Tfp pilus assembly protein PilF
MLQRGKKVPLAAALWIVLLGGSGFLAEPRASPAQAASPPRSSLQQGKPEPIALQLEFELRRQQGQSRYIKAGMKHVYRVELRTGQILRSAVQQLGIDVQLELFSPTGESILIIDSHNADLGPEPVLLTAQESGIYRMVVSTASVPLAESRYRIDNVTVAVATKADRRRASALKTYYQARVLLRRLRAARLDRQPAIDALLQSVRQSRAASYWELEGAAEKDLGDVYTSQNDLGRALDAYRRALLPFHQFGDKSQEARILNQIGANRLIVKDTDATLRCFRQARDLAHAAGDAKAEAVALNNAGMVLHDRGDTWEAARCFRDALLLSQAHDPDEEAMSLERLGLINDEMGQRDAAVDLYQRVLDLPRISPTERAVALSRLGEIYAAERRPDRAFQVFQQAIDIQRSVGDWENEASTLIGFGLADVGIGRLDDALDSYQQALKIYRSWKDLRGQAFALLNLGWVLAEQSRYEDANQAFRQALSFALELKNPMVEAGAHLGFAWMERRRDHLIEAQKEATEAVGLIEALRAKTLDSELRLSFFAKKQDAYDLLITTLMDQYERQRSPDLLAKALQVSESARARSLLDTVGAQAGSSAILPAQIISVREIQQQVLDSDTVLLEYWLGRSRAYLWMVTSDRLEGFVLADPAALEKLARETLGSLAEVNSPGDLRPTAERAHALSLALLGPVADRLQDKRLLIVAGGALQSVPFEALPDMTKSPSNPAGGQGGPEPLLLSHEIVYEPSASVLALIRKRSWGRQPAPQWLVTLADAVFERDDRRIPKSYRKQDGPVDPVLGRLSRLPATRAEADAITAGFPVGMFFEALDFKASRDLVLSGRLNDFRVVHIASHTFAPVNRPERAALVLSQVDERGRPRNGRVGIREVSSLSLRADLVVLSSCKSAAGKDVLGEGTVGLPHAFLMAGASGVVTTLWPIEDQSSSELIRIFYRNMLTRRMSVSSALRQAQIEMWKDPRRRAPRYWAGFIAEGEWKTSVFGLNKSPADVSSRTGGPRKILMTRKSSALLPSGR